MTNDDSTIRMMRGVAATLVMLLVGLLVTPRVSRWQSRQLVARLTAQVTSAEDNEVKIPLRQLAGLGDLAIEPLILAAASERETVASIARQILEEKLATWQLSTETAQARTDVHGHLQSSTNLASALSAHIEKFGPAGKQWAEHLALSLIDRADRLPARQTQILLDSCSQVLAAVPPRGTRLQTVNQRQERAQLRAHDRLPAPEPRLESLTRSSEASLEILARLQSSAPIEPSPQPNRSPLRWSPSKINSEQPTVSIVRPESRPMAKLESRSQPSHRSRVPSIGQVIDKKVDGQVIDIPTPLDMAARMTVLHQQTTEELLLRLNEARHYEAGALRIVLGARGYTEVELAVRKQLTSLDVHERLQLVQDTSRLPASSARRVLRWLLEDEEADVRLRALTALATTNAPELTKLVRRIAVEDEDPRVVKLATRLMRQPQ